MSAAKPPQDDVDANNPNHPQTVMETGLGRYLATGTTGNGPGLGIRPPANAALHAGVAWRSCDRGRASLRCRELGKRGSHLHTQNLLIITAVVYKSYVENAASLPFEYNYVFGNSLHAPACCYVQVGGVSELSFLGMGKVPNPSPGKCPGLAVGLDAGRLPTGQGASVM